MYHEFDVKTVIVGEVGHEGLEPSFFSTNVFEVVEGLEDDFMTALHQTYRREEF